MKINEEILKRFSSKNENWEEISRRVARICRKYSDKEEVFNCLFKGYLIPAGQILRGGGFPDFNLYNSYVSAINDGEKPKEIAKRISQWTRLGSGVGVNVSNWVRHQSLSESVALNKISTEIAKHQQILWEEGITRTATMINVDFDIEGIDILSEKISCNPIFRHLNIGVVVSDSAIKNIKQGEKNSFKKITKLIDCVWKFGNPGFIFVDRVNKDHPFNNEYINACNSCAEQFLLPNEGSGLASINLMAFVENGNFNQVKYEQTIRTGIKFLNDVIENSEYPCEESKRISFNRRRIGLGVLGYASALQVLGIEYDSEEAIIFSDYLAKTLMEISNDESKNLAIKNGTFPDFEKSTLKQSRYNSYLLSIAPTGAISMIWNVSSGIEPMFGNKIRKGNIILELTEDRINKSATDISWEYHIKTLATWQKYIDGGISKTVNCSNSVDRSDIFTAFMTAWKSGCKGISIFRDQSRECPIKVV